MARSAPPPSRALGSCAPHHDPHHRLHVRAAGGDARRAVGDQQPERAALLARERGAGEAVDEEPFAQRRERHLFTREAVGRADHGTAALGHAVRGEQRGDARRSTAPLRHQLRHVVDAAGQSRQLVPPHEPHAPVRQRELDLLGGGAALPLGEHGAREPARQALSGLLRLGPLALEDRVCAAVAAVEAALRVECAARHLDPEETLLGAEDALEARERRARETLARAQRGALQPLAREHQLGRPAEAPGREAARRALVRVLVRGRRDASRGTRQARALTRRPLERGRREPAVRGAMYGERAGPESRDQRVEALQRSVVAEVDAVRHQHVGDPRLLLHQLALALARVRCEPRRIDQHHHGRDLEVRLVRRAPDRVHQVLRAGQAGGLDPDAVRLLLEHRAERRDEALRRRAAHAAAGDARDLVGRRALERGGVEAGLAEVVHDHGHPLAAPGCQLGADRARLPRAEEAAEDVDRNRHRAPERAMLAGVSNAPPARILAAELVTSASTPEGFPVEGPPEVALLGRSNVGKSSLLNRLAQRRSLARTSRTPGRTRLVNFFRVLRPEGELRLVDLPGYGWARVGKSERRAWQALVEAYLAKRGSLRLALLLHDVRRDPGPDESDLLPWLAARGVPVLGVLTKLDTLGASERAKRLRALGEAGLALEWIATSARTGTGVEALWAAIDAAVTPRN